MTATARTGYFGLGLAGAVVGVVSCGISTGRPPLPPCLDPGPGSRLVGDNSGRPSCPPATPPPSCGSTHDVTYAKLEELPATPEHEAEVSVAIDPRPGSRLAYAFGLARRTPPVASWGARSTTWDNPTATGSGRPVGRRFRSGWHSPTDRWCPPSRPALVRWPPSGSQAQPSSPGR
jgi:hypothetical protein